MKRQKHHPNFPQIEKSNSLDEERLRQSRIKFNLACTFMVISAAFCWLTIVFLFLEKISNQTAIDSVNAIKVVAVFSSRLMENSRKQLNEDEEEE